MRGPLNCFSAAFASAVVLVSLTTSAGALPLLNGSFESPDIPDGTLQATSPTSWTGGVFLMDPDAAGQFSGDPYLWPQAQNGQQYEDIGNNNTSLSQGFAIALAGTYDFTWYANTALNRPPLPSPYSVTLLDSSLATVFNGNFDAYNAGVWKGETFSRALNLDTYTLIFTALGLPRGADSLIDNVNVIAVPEPGTLALFGFGIAGFIAARRRRTQNA